ncbi:MAG: PEP-CTERM sorting domain-containing protein [Planctomycetes bacterium]|nr:PEP-CTERM sorting domain-containing protein [Planctomycetota bacterium]
MAFHKIPCFIALMLAPWFSLTAIESAVALTLVGPNTRWQADPTLPERWHDEDNWTNGVPGATDNAAVDNGGIVHILRSAQAAGLNLTGAPNAVVKQMRGRSQFGILRIDVGTYELNRGVLDVAFVDIGRRPLPPITTPGIGKFVVPFFPLLAVNGPIALNSRPHPILPTTGAIALSPVEIPNVETINIPFRIPQVSRLEQYGGVLNVEEQLSVFAERFHITRGRVRANSILIDARGPFAPTAFLPVPEVSPGVWQEGGRVNVAGEVLIQDGTYTLEGGRFLTDRLVLGDPAMENTLSFWAAQRSPSFIQSGGSSYIAGNLEMWMPAFNIPESPLLPFHSVSYQLEGGRLRVDGDVIVGSMGPAPASFLQSGGRANFGGMLRIEGDASRYEISGGRLATDILEIGIGTFNTGGTFAFREPARVVVEDRISFGAESILEAVPGSTLRVRGGTFENFSQSEENLAGLNDLRLIFDGPDGAGIFEGSLSSYLEVGGQDLGDLDEGFEGNFALDTLRVGGRYNTTLQLVDLVDNQLDFVGVEALYVDRLVVAPGSTLDLGGISIYYRSARILGEVINGEMLNGAIVSLNAAAVPEPTTCSLFALGIALCAFWQRR